MLDVHEHKLPAVVPVSGLAQPDATPEQRWATQAALHNQHGMPASEGSAQVRLEQQRHVCGDRSGGAAKHHLRL